LTGVLPTLAGAELNLALSPALGLVVARANVAMGQLRNGMFWFS